MQVMYGIGGGLTIDYTPPSAPNPACCSDPEVLCPCCACKALERAGLDVTILKPPGTPRAKLRNGMLLFGPPQPRYMPGPIPTASRKPLPLPTSY